MISLVLNGSAIFYTPPGDNESSKRAELQSDPTVVQTSYWGRLVWREGEREGTNVPPVPSTIFLPYQVAREFQSFPEYGF